MADNNLMPLSVAKTVRTNHPIQALLEGISTGLMAALEARFRREQIEAEATQRQFENERALAAEQLERERFLANKDLTEQDLKLRKDQEDLRDRIRELEFLLTQSKFDQSGGGKGAASLSGFDISDLTPQQQRLATQAASILAESGAAFLEAMQQNFDKPLDAEERTRLSANRRFTTLGHIIEQIRAGNITDAGGVARAVENFDFLATLGIQRQTAQEEPSRRGRRRQDTGGAPADITQPPPNVFQLPRTPGPEPTPSGAIPSIEQSQPHLFEDMMRAQRKLREQASKKRDEGRLQRP